MFYDIHGYMTFDAAITCDWWFFFSKLVSTAVIFMLLIIIKMYFHLHAWLIVMVHKLPNKNILRVVAIGRHGIQKIF